MEHPLITSYNILQDKINTLRVQAKNAASQAITELTKDYFAKYPDTVEQIFFRIYTPWFNDGEGCELTVDEPQVVLFTDDSEDKYEEGNRLDNSVEYYEQKIKEWELFNADPEAYKDALVAASPNRFHRWDPRETYTPHYESVEELHEKIKQINAYPIGFVEDTRAIINFITSVEDTILEELFDNHVTVRITASGIEKEEYSHD